MLSFLKISNLAILEDVSIEPGSGLNVLTGETGAGKSIIVDAIGLLLGERGSADLIRTGCDRLVVEAQFDLSLRDDAAEIAALAGLEDPDARELVIRRELLPGGRGRAQVNGRIVALAELRTLGESLADLHGQHQHQSLLRADGQRDALDRYAGALEARGQAGRLYARLRSLQRERDDLAARERERALHEESLRRQIGEIDGVAPRAGEDEDLAREESLLRHAEEVSRLAARSFALVSDDDESVMARLGAAEECLARLAAIDPQAAEVLRSARESRLAAGETARGLSRYIDMEAFDPQRLEQVASRLADLGRLRRKYGASLQEVLDHRQRAGADLAALGAAASRLQEVADELVATRDAYARCAAELSGMRRRAAVRLEKSVEKELKALAMDGARVAIAVTPAPDGEPGPHGSDVIEFLIAPNQGEDLRPLARIASGGELSRLMLAVRNAAQGGRTDQRTLVFDEVDSGIGGVVAEVVGRRLASLGGRQQVLCVTHLPQIASFADRHFRVIKRTSGARTQASIGLLDEKGRVDELARMLGSSTAETAKRHAAAMLDKPARSAGPSGRTQRRPR